MSDPWMGRGRPRAEFEHEGEEYIAILTLVPWHRHPQERADIGGDIEIYRDVDGMEQFVGYAHDLARAA
jgi:hypothetical protein